MPPTETSRAPVAPLPAAIVAEAVQRLERAGPLDDAAELRQAFRMHDSRAAQVRARAWLLGQRLGLPRELARWRLLALWAAGALALAMLLAALATGRAVLAPDRSINAVAAFVSLLGWHALTLLAWLGGLLGAGRGAGDWSLGRAALALAARVPFDRGPHAVLLLRSTGAVLRRARLWPWLTGWISHTIWALSFVLLLVLLGFGFAFQAYRLSWETTILSPAFFERFVAVTGALPALLGFAVPDAEAVRQVGSAAPQAVLAGVSQRDWAWWLMGCVFCYGLAPRVLLAAFSYVRWRGGQARLAQLDMTDPDVLGIALRLDALEPPPEVIDPERQAGSTTRGPGRQGAPGAAGTLALVGFELPPEAAWPPEGAPASALPVLRVSGSAAERDDALAQLAAARPAALLLAVHASASPDRGTARFVRDAAALSGRTAVWLLHADAAAQRRWSDWLQSSEFSEPFRALALVGQAQAAMNWVASGNV